MPANIVNSESGLVTMENGPSTRTSDVKLKRREILQHMKRVLGESLLITTMERTNFGFMPTVKKPLVFHTEREVSEFVKERIKGWLQTYVRYQLDECTVLIEEMLK